jgi:3-deoxy-D-manno-octulosonate 8-phosphate phosphatase (KDO 8-P phosphatase)
MTQDDILRVRPGGRGFPTADVYTGIKLVVFDVDGVLTDGRIVLDSNGIESKFFNVRDGAGITFLHYAELMVAMVTGRSSEVVEVRARELKIPIERVRQGARVKLPVFEDLIAECGVTAAESAYVGDDIIDVPVLERVGLACCPGDAHPEVIKLSHVVSGQHGGRGGVRAICEHLLKQRADGAWDKAINRYLGRA